MLKMKNRFMIMLSWMLLLCSCGRIDIKDQKSDLLGIDISSAKIISEEDDHGGFHGDGMTFISLDCEGTDIADQISSDDSWISAPLNDTVRILVYGCEDETTKIGPYLSDEDGNPLIPEIENGYYLLIDRQAEEGKATGADILHRASLNFTLGIYDSDTNRLYYVELDT